MERSGRWAVPCLREDESLRRSAVAVGQRRERGGGAETAVECTGASGGWVDEVREVGDGGEGDGGRAEDSRAGLRLSSGERRAESERRCGRTVEKRHRSSSQLRKQRCSLVSRLRDGRSESHNGVGLHTRTVQRLRPLPPSPPVSRESQRSAQLSPAPAPLCSALSVARGATTT